MENNKTQKIIIILLVLALLVAVGLLAMQLLGGEEELKGPSQTAVIEKNEAEELTPQTAGQIRIKINPVVEVKNDTLQNLNFCNYNEERKLQCKIKVGEEYVYDSGRLEPGMELKGDWVAKPEALESGENEATAEIYSYDLEDNPIGQTNVNIVLNKVD